VLLENEITGQERKLELAFAGLVALALVALTFAVTKFAPTHDSIAGFSATPEPIVVFPDFASISDIDEKKQQFFDFLQDYVRYENSLVSDLRLRLLSYAEIVGDGVPLSGRERQWVIDLAVIYGVEAQTTNDQGLVKELLLSVDVIPASLVLAQAANESAWGTSRFALEGNNIFGQWCFVEGCGIIPKRRIEGATHEVKSFASIEAAIEGYFLNINSHNLYVDFREERARLRRLGLSLNSIELAEGLENYSQRGANYIDEVQTLIYQNNLRRRDRRWIEK
jgi:Bax protein